MPLQEEKIVIGAQLKTARENMGLSIPDAAARLHLSRRFITVLENEDLLNTNLPPIYLRGYLRSYARLLNLPEKELNPVLNRLAPIPDGVLAPVPTTSETTTAAFPLEEKDSRYARVATLVIFALLLTSITAWWQLHHSSNPPPELALNPQPAVLTAEPQLSANSIDKQPTKEPVDMANSLSAAFDKHNTILDLTGNSSKLALDQSSSNPELQPSDNGSKANNGTSSANDQGLPSSANASTPTTTPAAPTAAPPSEEDSDLDDLE